VEVFKIQLTVATNWDLELIEKLSKYPVRDLYGSAPHTIVGGGRPQYIIPEVSNEEIAEFISKVHQYKMEFSYLLNAPCMSNLEYKSEYYRKLVEYIQWIVDIGADNIIITIPFLIQLVHEQFPQIKIRVSTIAHVNSVNRAKFYAEMGASEITPDVMINRDFRTLEKMKKALRKHNCDIVLLLTDGCLFQCPFRLYHYNILGHASQTYHQVGHYLDTCLLNCSLIKYTNPTEVVKCRWIRPEDLVHYEEIGIDKFKIAGRRMDTSWLVRAVDAYSNRKYEGNLVDIIQGFSFSSSGSHKKDKNIGFRESLDREYLAKLYIDNTKLDGFIEFFKKQNCNAMCDECKYCEEWAKKVVRLNKEQVDSYTSYVKDYLDDIISGREFGLKPKKKKKKVKKGMDWDPKTEELFNKVIEATPDEFKQVAKMAIGSMAEGNARARNSQIVENEDMVKAFLEGTPAPFQADMKETLKKLGLKID